MMEEEAEAAAEEKMLLTGPQELSAVELIAVVGVRCAGHIVHDAAQAA